MITNNVIHRVFRICWQQNRGTAFAISVDGREYIVTARHVVSDIPVVAAIGIHARGRFEPFPVRLVGVSSPDVDVAVFAGERALTNHQWPAEPSAGGLVYGQDVYFLGFPYDMVGTEQLSKDGYPLPFVKKATLSQFFDGVNGLFLDGINNPGFSGGPVVFTPPGEREQKICAVISGYKSASGPIFEGGLATPLVHSYNTGIIVAPSINRALSLIQANPIGCDTSGP